MDVITLGALSISVARVGGVLGTPRLPQRPVEVRLRVGPLAHQARPSGREKANVGADSVGAS